MAINVDSFLNGEPERQKFLLQKLSLSKTGPMPELSKNGTIPEIRTSDIPDVDVPSSRSNNYFTEYTVDDDLSNRSARFPSFDQRLRV